MTKVKEFTKASVRAMRANLDSDLSKIGKKYGIDFSLGTISFDSVKFTTRMTAKINSPAAKKKVSDSVKTNFMMYVKMYHPNLNASKMFNAKFNYKGRVYKIVDYKPRSVKYPFVCESTDNGGQYGFPPSIMERNFKK